VKVLVTGAAGQVGREVVEVFERAGHDVTGFDHAALDVSDRDAVLGAVIAVQPQLIVHPAAWTAVDACEADPDRAFRTNALAVRHVAEAAGMVGAHVTSVSTDYVFDGTKPAPYLEWDRPNPQSVYGRSKLGGELELLGAGAGHTLVRTSWVCGRYGGNMVKTVLRLVGEDPHRELAFVDDQRGHPTFADDLAAMIMRLSVERRPGVFHVTNQGAVSWFEFVQAIVEAAGLSPQQVRPISTADLDPPRPAPRPANSVLENAALHWSGLALLPHFSDPLARLVRHLRDR
jgi:dTDP-4-dehydrorhamnose reductase